MLCLANYLANVIEFMRKNRSTSFQSALCSN